MREKNDVKTIRAQLKASEMEIRSAIAKIGDGVPLEVFHELLPEAYYDNKNDEWRITIPTGYDENPACTNLFSEDVFFRLDGSTMKPVEFKSGRGFSHGDRFGVGGAWYYFWRAWYSSVDFQD